MQVDSDIEITTNEMVLDMDTFDFNLIDTDEEVVEQPEEVSEEVEDEESEVEDIEDEEEETSEEDEEAEEAAEEAEETGDEEVDYETYEVTLPSGENVALAQLVTGYRNNAALEQARAEFETAKNTFEEKAANIENYMKLAVLEADRVIDDYEDFDWATLSKEDPASYVEHREFLDKYRARKDELVVAMRDIEEKAAAEAKRLTDEKARETNAVLVRDIPGWGKDMYRTLLEYAVEKGIDQDFILNCVEPSVFKVLHKNMEVEKGVQKVTAKVKRVGSPKKVVRPSAKETKAPDTKKTAILKKVEKGDFSSAFDYLED